MMRDEFETENNQMPNVLLDEIEDFEEEELEEHDGPCSCGDDDDVRFVNDEPLCAACRIANDAIDADEESDDEVDPSRLD